jgi:hypothetical protein
LEPVKLVDLDASSVNKELFTGERAPIRVHGRYSDNTEKSISDGLQWHLSDPALASVNSNGELVALRPGKVEVSARSGDRQSSPLTFLIKESPKAMLPQVKPDKPSEPRPVKAPAATEQTRARIAAAISRAGSFRGQGNYAAALTELEKAKAIDKSNEEIRKEIEQTRRACKAEVVLGNKINC